MTLPVIADVFRVAFNWNQIEGIRPVNVIHVRASAAIELDVVTVIFNAVQTDQFSPLPIGFTCDSMTITKLDGTSAAVVVHAPAGGDITGAQTANAIAGEAVVVSFATGLRGPAHRGRFFMGPVAENVVSGGTFDGDTAAISTHWEDWRIAMLADTPSVEHVVASYVHASAAPVSTYDCKKPLGSARRRLLQVR